MFESKETAAVYIREKYPYGLLVSTKLKERRVMAAVPNFFGTVPREPFYKEWRFSTLEDRKTFREAYRDFVLGEIPVAQP
jgi:hypothetical protein